MITCSDRAARGETPDGSGPIVRDALLAAGYDVETIIIVPDEIEAISDAITTAADKARVDLIVTTGGTGISPRDVTPEATNRVTTKFVPGFGELMRARSLDKTPMAPLSRAQAAIRGSALVVNLPGSVAAASENLNAVIHLFPHALELLHGQTDHKNPP